MTATNPSLNTDVLSHIFSFVSSPRDLLAVSLTNNQLSSLADPELVYRSVRCRLGNDAVWEHLIANPAHASRVRELEIQRENFSGYGGLDEAERAGRLDLAGAVQTEEDIAARQTPSLEKVERSEGLLIRAVKVLVNLESFKWDRWVPVINEGDPVLSNGESTAEEGEERVPEVYKEDIWTALRGHTQVRRIWVVDLGNTSAIVPNPHNIFDSKLLTLSGLTHLDLKIFYSPANEDEGVGGGGGGGGGGNGGSDTDEEDEVILPRVNITRLQEFLLRCPDLEHLSLTIYDHNFFLIFNGNPYTDIAPLFASAHWPRLSYLKLSDLVISDPKITTKFLATHPNLRTLSASLSLFEDSLPGAPFSIDSGSLARALDDDDGTHTAFLPNLTTLDLDPALARSLLRAAIKHRLPSSSLAPPVTTISTLEPRDWGCTPADGDPDDNDGDGSAFDAVWGAPENGQGSEAHADVDVDVNVLKALPEVRSLTAKNVCTLVELEKLAAVAPQLESLNLMYWSLRGFHNDMKPHVALLPVLSRWPHLTSFTGPPIWAIGIPDVDKSAKKILAIASAVVAACPTLRKVSWTDGSIVVLESDETGKVVRLGPVR